MALPDQAGIAGFRDAALGVTERGVPALAVGADQPYAAIEQPWRGRVEVPARVFTTTIYKGARVWPIHFNSAWTSFG